MSTKMISKELLEAVLEFKVMNFYVAWNYLHYSLIGCRAIDDCEEYEETINIYELAHKCKEWVSKQGYTFCTFGQCTYLIHDSEDHDTIYNMFERQSFYGNSEPEAIFKASEWVFEQLKQ